MAFNPRLCRVSYCGVDASTATGYVMIAYSGRPSNMGISSAFPSQAALLDEKMCAVGNIVISVSKHPAGMTSKPSTCVFGNAEPHNLQKLLLWRVPGSVKAATDSLPATQVNLAECENRFAA